MEFKYVTRIVKGHFPKNLILFLLLLHNLIIAQTETKMIPSSGSENGWFGASVSIDGNSAIIGAPGNPNIIGNPGSAFIYERENGVWVEKIRLAKPNGKEMELFGNAVSISGEIALVGVPRDDLGFSIDNGSVFVYAKSDDKWTFQAQLMPADSRDGHQFGYSVDIDGNTAIVGAIHANGYRGAAYIFELVGTEWKQQAVLTASDGLEASLFGYAVAISGPLAIIGRPETPAGGRGSAYLFKRTGSGWTQQSKLVANDGRELDDFGISVDIDGLYAIVGAPKHDHENGAEYDEGAAYVFSVPNGSQVAKLRIKEGLNGFAGQFAVGGSVAISGNKAVLGAIGSGGPKGMTGAAYIFSATNWEEESKLLASDGEEENFFGFAVSIFNSCPLIGARRASPLAYESGVAYIFCGNAIAQSPVEVSVDLDIHRPKVIDINESPIEDSGELSKGSQTFVNLDNDDNDYKFDFEDPDGVEGGDDELVLLEIKLEPANIKKGTVTLEATAGAEYIRLWHNADRTVEVNLPVSFNLADATVLGFREEGESLIMKLWVEGIKPHTHQRATSFKMTYEDDTNNCFESCEDEVALTIIGVKSQTWLGRQNGYTSDSLSFNSNTLDIDPNFPAGRNVDELTTYGADIPLANRVFTGARAPDFGKPNDQVDLEIELTVAPVEDLSLFVRSLDCDDPSMEAIFIDPNDMPSAGRYIGADLRYSSEEDNRGGTVSSGKAGFLTGQDNEGIAKLIFASGGSKRKIEFRVSHFPGDSYRAVVNGDKDFLLRLRNFDHFDGFRIVDPEVTGSAADREIPYAMDSNDPVYASNVLTVWRLLHIESDAMIDPPTRDPKLGNIIDLNAAFSRITVDISLDDGSADLDSRPPESGNIDCENQDPGQGRFERGTMIVAGTTEFQVDANGNNYVFVSGGTNIAKSPLPCTIVDSRGGVIFGHVTGIIKDEGWRLTLKASDRPGNTIGWSQLKGGVITLDAGPVMTISDVFEISNSIEVSSLSIPFVLYDDDKTSSIGYSDISDVKRAFKNAYVFSTLDGGGNLKNNTKSVPFIRNTTIDDVGLMSISESYWDSKHNETDLFWVAYIVSAYEYAPCHGHNGSIRGDGDPDHEQPVYGITPPGETTHHTLLSVGGDVSYIFMEAERDGRASSKRRIWRNFDHSVNVAHEVGHQFGLHHNHLGLMNGTLRDGRYFNPESLNLIRCRVHSPGEDR